jgi:hypothetical protein
MPKDLTGRAGAQPIGVLDPLTAGQGGVDQRHGLVPGVGRAGRSSQLKVGVEQVPRRTADARALLRAC